MDPSSWLYLLLKIYAKFQFAIFLGIITMGDNHVASCID
jgi:hypothetical protein